MDKRQLEEYRGDLELYNERSTQMQIASIWLTHAIRYKAGVHFETNQARYKYYLPQSIVRSIEHLLPGEESAADLDTE